MDLSYLLRALIFSLNYDLLWSLQCIQKETTENFERHECQRTCEYPPKPKVCEYVLEAHWFYSLSSYCFDCPVRLHDCFLDQCVPLDGSSRPVVVTNMTIPGPSIQVCEGDIVQVKLMNKLQDGGSLTIHWYGMHQEGTNWMDGVTMVTQCPIVSWSSFYYEFKASPAGTHWWHAHSGYQRDDGMYGSLIVRQAKEIERNSNMYDFDLPEHVMMIADWWGRPAMSTLLMTESPTSYVLPSSQTSSILINGKAKEVPYEDSYGTEHYTPEAKFKVETGKTYRFRVISSVFGLCNLQVMVESHPLTIIAVDGAEVTPKEVDSFVIAPGERYDFLLRATAEPKTYCMYSIGTSSTNCAGDGVAILQYASGTRQQRSCLPISKSTPVLTDTKVFSIMDSHSLVNVDQDLYKVDAKYYISLSHRSYSYFSEDGRRMRSMINNFQMDNVNFIYPNSPILSSKQVSLETCKPNEDRLLYSKCASEVCDCTSIMKLPLGKVVEFIVYNAGKDDYSIHIHGTSFRVLAQEALGESRKLTKSYIQMLDNQGQLERISPAHALYKDTVNVPALGYVILRWKADNPGYWFFHSQINSHLEAGQATILQVGEDNEIPKPPEGMPTCGPWAKK